MIRSKLLHLATTPILIIVAAVLFQVDPLAAQETEQSAHKPATVEHYYRVKWGYFDEFYALFRKNHYPILQRLKETGEILEMHAAFPVHHDGESDRWDMRFTIVYANPKHTYEFVYGPDLIEELYPDQETFKLEEQRRFALLIQHTDVPIRVDDLSDWNTD
jgi:hypothetical protein